MGYLVTTQVLSLLAMIHGSNFYHRQCLLHNGRCVVACPRQMQPYHTRCDGQTLSQRTCASPAHYVLGYTCGWSRCDCAGDLLFDETNGYCVNEHECPPYAIKPSKNKNRRGERRNHPRTYRKSKKVEIREEEEPFP